jgi:penicillin-binding protein 2
VALVAAACPLVASGVPAGGAPVLPPGVTASIPSPPPAPAAVPAPPTVASEIPSGAAVAADGRSANDAKIFNRPNARTIASLIPAPRGPILDREGEPLANNRVAYHLAINYGQFEVADRDFVVSWARKRLEEAAKQVQGVLTFTDEDLWLHYRHRRWLPLIVSGFLKDAEFKKLEGQTGVGLILFPVYARNYPEGATASHIIGYSGSIGKLPTGPINQNEPMFEEIEGRAGIEKLFDQALRGVPGRKRLLFDSDGSKLLEEQTLRPRPGGTVVTTLNLRWQKLAESVLEKGCERGAFVVIDIATGEVLVMASRPGFDLNRFVPGISNEAFQALQDDPGRPLFSRAFQGAYPPASSFKPVVALAALNAGTVSEETLIDSPASITLGNHTFHNWTKVPEGAINVRRAIARSCNTWFYQVGIRVGPTAFLGLARQLGFGAATGLPLIGETPGLVPTNEWMLKNERRRILDGDTANLSIGQGVLLASPLQVAQGMAGIGHGTALPKLQLIRQVQNINGGVIFAEDPERKNWLGVDPQAAQVVRAGMRDVVNGGGGTGHGASLSFTELCGKTGTAQWGPPSKNQRLAWFTGFLPYDNPRYAFAVLYEGKPNQTVSGGRMAAPMVKSFFETLKDEIKESIAPPQRAVVVIAEDDSREILRALPVEDIDPATGLPQASAPGTPPASDLTPAPPVGQNPDEGGAIRALPVDESEIRPDPPADGLRHERPVAPVQTVPDEDVRRALPVEEP